VRDVTVVISAWEKGKYGNIPSIRRMYPESRIFIPQTDALIEENHTMLNVDTLIQCGRTVFHLDVKHDEISLSFKMGKNEIVFKNIDSCKFPIIPINENRASPRHFTLYGNYLYKR